MFNICPGCGEYADEKEIDPAGPFAICPFCGYRHRFAQLPLFVIGGASGTGKSTIGLSLIATLPECVIMESDILWRPEFATPADGYRSYRNLWLRVAKNIGQAGRPVVLIGTALPEQFEDCPERRYFTEIHYLALVCDDGTLAERLRGRLAWRRSGTPQFLDEMLRFNRWLKEHAASTTPPMSLLDITGLTVQEAGEQSADWVRLHVS